MIHIPSRNIRFDARQRCGLIVHVIKKFLCAGHAILFMSWRCKIKCHRNLIKYYDFSNFVCHVYGRLCSSCKEFFEFFGLHSVFNALMQGLMTLEWNLIRYFGQWNVLYRPIKEVM